MSNDWPSDAPKLSPIRVTRKLPRPAHCDGHGVVKRTLKDSLKRCPEQAIAAASWEVRGSTNITMRYCERHLKKLVNLHQDLGARRVIVEGEGEGDAQ